VLAIRIIWFSHRDLKHPRSGGAEKTIYEVGRRLVQYGNDVKWISVATDSLPVTDVLSGIKVVRLPSNAFAHISVPIILRREKYEVVVDDMAHAVPWGSENFNHSRGTVFFHHLHRKSLKGQISLPAAFLVSGIEALYPFIYRHWPFVTESKSSFKDLKSIGINSDRILKIPPGLNVDDFMTFEKTEEPSLVYFGGMRDYKRPWESLYVLKDLITSYKDIHLFMVGSGPSLDRVREISKSIGVDKYVTFTGRLSDHQLKEIVGKAWVNVHSSLTEGFGFSIIEASAQGTPTVAYGVSGVSEAVEDGKNGILVEDGNRKLMVEAIIKIIDGYSGNWECSSQSVAKKYSWDNTADLWESHLEGVLNGNWQ
jgi:glycosyltransferase involved in cell wall biosynthesis